MTGVFLLEGGCDTYRFNQTGRRACEPLGFQRCNQESTRGQKIGFLCSSLSSERAFQPQPLCHPGSLSFFPLLGLFGLASWTTSLSLNWRQRIQHRSRQTWASTCFHLLCEFWHIVLLLNFWGLYYIMLCYIVLYYNLLGVIMKVNEIMHVRFLAGFLAYCKHQEIIYILSMQPS